MSPVYGFVFQVISNNTVPKIVLAILETFNKKINLSILPTNLVTNSRLCLFCSIAQTK